MSKIINILVEGPAEKGLVTKVIEPHLKTFGHTVNYRVITTSWGHKTTRRTQGGVSNWNLLLKDVKQWALECQYDTQNVWLTTMFDFYGLSQAHNFNYAEVMSGLIDPTDRLNKATEHLAKLVNSPNFIPYFQMHEYESLLFSDISILKSYFPKAITKIKKLKTETSHLGPEEINERIELAPSKRILNIIPEYNDYKADESSDMIKALGLPFVRTRCPHFDSWLSRLESL